MQTAQLQQREICLWLPFSQVIQALPKEKQESNSGTAPGFDSSPGLGRQLKIPAFSNLP